MSSDWDWVLRFRYSADRPIDSPDEFGLDISELWQSELAISPLVTPQLAASLETVRQRLGIPAGACQGFVFQSPHVQAFCGIVDASHCVVRFSSALVELLTPEEFQFVAGHELGHFIFGHRRRDTQSGNLESLLQSRAQEISVDRAGLLGCESLNDALGAIMKTASGLSSRHIRFDVTTFVAQLEEAGPSLTLAGASHPSLVCRARALLWFSLLGVTRRNASAIDEDRLGKIDDSIKRDLRRLIDEPILNHLEELKRDVLMWASVREIARGGVFTRESQAAFATRFGEDVLLKVSALMADAPVDELEAMLAEKEQAARERLRLAAPEIAASTMAACGDRSGSATGFASGRDFRYEFRVAAAEQLWPHQRRREVDL